MGNMFMDFWILGILQITAPTCTLKNTRTCPSTSPRQMNLCVERIRSSQITSCQVPFQKKNKNIKSHSGYHVFQRQENKIKFIPDSHFS